MKKQLTSASLLLLFFACQTSEPPLTGEALAKIHCGSCHAYPEPALLDRRSWDEHILPRMGYLLGALPLDSVGVSFIEPAVREAVFQNHYIARRESPITPQQWRAIRDFYLKNAPAKPLEVAKPGVERTLPQFSVKFPAHHLSPPSTTLVKFLGNDLFLGDVHTQRLYQFDQDLALQNMANTAPAPVCLNEVPEGYLVTSMGSFSPTDMANGQVLFLPKSSERQPLVLLDSLRRPVHTTVEDLDGDGRFDLIISEFGKWAGRLCWWKNDGEGQFEPHLLRDMPGAIRTVVRDLNADGRPDVTALFGQGDEGIFIFWNEGNGQFREERALRFPPSYGSSYFDFFDFDGDEHPDLIYTCGDNADFPPVAKAYHGIRIFQNDGANGFTEKFFFPMQGAYAAIPADFDLDGDLDIAAISFFPDFEKRPEASFLFLEGQGGGLDFRPHTFPSFARGRWMVMDAGDPDNDGDLDLVLGSLAFETVPDLGLVAQWLQGGVPFVLLENLAR